MLIFTPLCQIEIQPHILLIIICAMNSEIYAHFYAILPKYPHQMHLRGLLTSFQKSIFVAN